MQHLFIPDITIFSRLDAQIFKINQDLLIFFAVLCDMNAFYFKFALIINFFNEHENRKS